MTREQRTAILTRADLLAEVAALKVERRVTWAGMLRDLGDYGRSGGSALDRRLIVEGMAALEAEAAARVPAAHGGVSSFTTPAGRDVTVLTAPLRVTA